MRKVGERKGGEERREEAFHWNWLSRSRNFVKRKCGLDCCHTLATTFSYKISTNFRLRSNHVPRASFYRTFFHRCEAMKNVHLHFFKKWANPGLFLVYFRSFSNKQYNFYNKQMWKMLSPSSIQHRDSNPWHLEHESSPITTRQGLPSKCVPTLCEEQVAYVSTYMTPPSVLI